MITQIYKDLIETDSKNMKLCDFFFFFGLYCKSSKCLKPICSPHCHCLLWLSRVGGAFDSSYYIVFSKCSWKVYGLVSLLLVWEIEWLNQMELGQLKWNRSLHWNGNRTLLFYHDSHYPNQQLGCTQNSGKLLNSIASGRFIKCDMSLIK